MRVKRPLLFSKSLLSLCSWGEGVSDVPLSKDGRKRKGVGHGFRRAVRTVKWEKTLSAPHALPLAGVIMFTVLGVHSNAQPTTSEGSGLEASLTLVFQQHPSHLWAITYITDHRRGPTATPALSHSQVFIPYSPDKDCLSNRRCKDLYVKNFICDQMSGELGVEHPFNEA